MSEKPSAGLTGCVVVSAGALAVLFVAALALAVAMVVRGPGLEAVIGAWPGS